MFDAKRLLGQVIASQMGGGSRGGTGGMFGSSGVGDLARSFGGGSGGGGAALAGGLASLLLGSKGGRKLGGSALKMGGMALIGSLAYDAYQKWQAGQAAAGAGGGAPRGFASPAPSPWVGGQPAGQAQSGSGSAGEPPRGTPFNPSGEAEQQSLARNLLRAMISAAKSDGQIDATEQSNIFGAMDRFELDPDDKAFILDEMRAPLDIDAIARSARNPEEASEIYAASLLAIDVDSPAERGYLSLLAARLKLDDALVAHLHATLEEAGRVT